MYQPSAFYSSVINIRTYRQVWHSAILRSAHTAYLWVLCGYENKQRLFPYTTLNCLVFITEMECVYCAVRNGSLYIIQVNCLSLTDKVHNNYSKNPTITKMNIALFRRRSN
jgi:hypothetical protein